MGKQNWGEGEGGTLGLRRRWRLPSQAMKLLTPHFLNFPALYNSLTPLSVSSIGTLRSGACKYHKSTDSVPSAFKLSSSPLRMSAGARCVTGRLKAPWMLG